MAPIYVSPVRIQTEFVINFTSYHNIIKLCTVIFDYPVYASGVVDV